MRKLIIRYMLLGLALTAIGLGGVALTASGSGSGPKGSPNNIYQHQLAIEQGNASPKKYEQPLSGGVMSTLLQAYGPAAGGPNGFSGAPHAPGHSTQGCAHRFTAGGTLSNTRVNQDCSYRRQAEEVVAINPTDPSNLIGGQNDSRIGFNHCGYDWSFDGGKTWGDQLPPFWSYVQSDGHTADACSDPTATFDSKGNAYVGGVIFDIASNANSIVVQKSNAGIGGAFYHTPTQGQFQTASTDPIGLVATTNDSNHALDKEFIVADATASSPKADNVYATYTLFEDGHSPIYFSQSTDGGATWSPGIEISGANSAYCTVGSAESDPNACDQDQGSHPIVGRDGTVYVAFLNGNIPGAGIGQHMMVKCLPNDDCSNPTSWSAPVRMGDIDYGTQPRGPVNSTGCPGGRRCLPPNGYRMSDSTEGSISVDDSGNLYSVWADFRNGQSNCNPNGSAATATPPCDNDVFYTYSTDGGATWSSTVKLTPAGSAQWQPWSAVTGDGEKLFVAYYDRSYGNCEFDGCNDITLATVKNAATGSPSVSYQRVTTSSMPNLTNNTGTPTDNPVQAGFLGDYIWVAADAKNQAHIVWADTRGLGGFPEEDIYYARAK
jgi:hypothetical protein